MSPRLMILMPPRHGKSELASRMFPAWHLGRYPDHEFIACSYNVSLAMTFSRKVKDTITDPSYESVFPTRLNPNHQSSEEWGLANDRGGYCAAGVGGGITGKGAHILLIDDPIKNAEEADSADVREKLWDWYGSTAYTRLAPGGGVLVIQCMTGDTPVLMAHGGQQRLDSLTEGDQIATYDRGLLSTSFVRGIKANGRDSVLKITTSSGKVVHANGRHPFLVATNGELKWVRARALTTDHKIVAVKASGENGEVLPAPQRGASSRQSAEASVPLTMAKRSGLTDTAHQASTPKVGAKHTSSTVTESLPPSTTDCSSYRMECAQSASGHRTERSRITGKTNSPSITATKQDECADCCAMTATQESDILELSLRHLPRPGISDFTLDAIVSIAPDGVEEVFDVQVEGTENFIANGLVSHNTWWHDDDLAGRLQTAMQDAEADQFEVVKYPAIATGNEYLELATDDIVLDVDPAMVAGPSPPYRLLRLKNEALHAARYDEKKLARIRKTIPDRFWSALYQQNPVPEDGAYFTKDQFKRGPIPEKERCNVMIAWDFAITEKKANDYTVGTVGLQDDDDLLHVAEVMRFKSDDSHFIVEAIINLAIKWKHKTMVLGFEDGQIFKTMASLLKRRMRERQSEIGFYPSIQILAPITDKKARARPLQGRMQQGAVSFNQQGEWFDPVRAEMLRFPNGVHDDCVDSAAWLATLAVDKAPPRKPRQEKTKSWRDQLSRLGAGAVSHMAA